MPETGRSPRIALIADTGADLYHVGDEAMLAANVEGLRARGCEVRVIGRIAVDDGSTRSALALAASPAIPARRRRRSSTARSPAPTASSSSGGGNLASAWPDLLWQRVHLLRAARRRGLPTVTGGQTIGPDLDFAERRALWDALAGVEQLGVCERASQLRALELGVPGERIRVQPDDAFLFGGAPVSGLPEGPFVAVSFDPGLAQTTDPAVLDARGREPSCRGIRTAATCGRSIVIRSSRSGWRSIPRRGATAASRPSARGGASGR